MFEEAQDACYFGINKILHSDMHVVDFLHPHKIMYLGTLFITQFMLN